MQKLSAELISQAQFCAKLSVMKLQILLEASPDGGFTVTVPALPGCISQGETKKEAIANIEEAIALYLEPVSDDYLVLPQAELLEIAV